MGLYFKDHKPFIEGQNILELTSKVPTPFYIYSQKVIQENYNKLKTNLKREIFYSVKANSNQSIIKLLDSIGAGIDVVSVEELKRALEAKVSPGKIIFEGVGKSEKDIEFAITKNIRQINVESIEELILIEEISKKLNNTTSIGIRINPDIDAKSLDKISTGRKTDKFGIGSKELSNVCNIIKKSEKESIKFRRSIFSSLKIKAGEKITTKNIIALRPAIGIDASKYFNILGKTAKFNIPKDSPIFKKHLIN